MPLTFLVGGARSGKSSLAVRLVSSVDRPVTVIATAEARDDDMVERIAAHRAARPPAWRTVESPLGLADAVDAVPSVEAVILDCLTLWVSNALEAGATDGSIVDEASRLAETLSRREPPAIVVSNEVGLGIVPMHELSRRYRDVLGRVNAAVGSVAERSYFVVAGRGIPLGEVTLA